MAEADPRLASDDADPWSPRRRKLSPSQPESFAGQPNIAIQPDFERFDQHNDMFCRGFWDRGFSNKNVVRFFRSFVKPGERFRDKDGYQQRDYALRNGPWVVTEMLAELKKAENRRDGFWDPFSAHVPPKVAPMPIADEAKAARDIKRIAKLYGADLVGITDYDDRLTYASGYSARTNSCKPVELPDGLTNVIVFAKSMDYDLIRTSPAATASTAPAMGYAHDATILLALAQYIRSLGYEAVANQNDTTLAIPYAIKAGLGEYGRNGLLITPEYGPRIRLARILTNMPLAHDSPKKFGVEETCTQCRRCANNCPPQAIDHGDPSDFTYNASNIKGVKKWTTDGEKCFTFWVSKGTDCANCIRTCPYNKPVRSLRGKLIRWMLGTRLRGLALKWDDGLRWHDQKSGDGWWDLTKANARAAWETIAKADDSAPDTRKHEMQMRLRKVLETKRAKES
ncbi:MAG: reductive dehalogenase domain-containing protein [Pseudomonadota bacterium]